MNEAKKYGWRLFNLQINNLTIPDDLNPIGALIRYEFKDQVEDRIKALDIPVIYIGQFPFHPTIPYITADIKKIGAMAAEYFSDLGFSRLTFIGNKPWGNYRYLYEGYDEAATKKNCECLLFQIESIKGGPEQRQSKLGKHEQVIREWLLSIPKPVGLLVYSDKVASRYAMICLRAGLRVPEDVAILGVGNNEFLCETAQVPISSIEFPWPQIWGKAFDQLNEAVQGKEVLDHQICIAPNKIVERRSTDVIPLDDPLVAKAVKYIWAEYGKDIGVESFLRTDSASRSTLQRKFQKHLKRGFNEELKRKRLEVAKRYLLNSNETSQRISELTGFRSQSYFHKVFLDEFGCTPTVYREEISQKLEKSSF